MIADPESPGALEGSGFSFGRDAAHPIDPIGADAVTPLSGHQVPVAEAVAQPVRLAMTGGLASPPIHETVFVVGRERAIARIEAAIKLKEGA